MGFADLHIHTIYSYDGTASVPAVLARAEQVGLHVIAITDHDEIKGALRAFDLAPSFGIEVIPGSEITTAEGDLLALFVTEKIEPGLSLMETLVKVGEAGGICIAPHPMARGMGMKSLSALSIIQALHHPDTCHILLASRPTTLPLSTGRAMSMPRHSRRNALALRRWATAMHISFKPLGWAPLNSWGARLLTCSMHSGLARQMFVRARS